MAPPVSTSAIRAHLTLQQQYDALDADLRCLAEALDEGPALSPPAVVDESVPTYTRDGAAVAFMQPALDINDVAELEERTFSLLDAMNGTHNLPPGPLMPEVLAHATPPPSRVRKAVLVHAGEVQSTASAMRTAQRQNGSASMGVLEPATMTANSAKISELRRLPDAPPPHGHARQQLLGSPFHSV